MECTRFTQTQSVTFVIFHAFALCLYSMCILYDFYVVEYDGERVDECETLK